MATTSTNEQVSLDDANAREPIAPEPMPSPPPPPLGGEASAPYAPTFGAGAQASDVIERLNGTAARVDAAASLAAGMPGVVRGLALSPGPGLSVVVSPGLACAGGLVECAGITKSLPATEASLIWLTGDGQIAATPQAGQGSGAPFGAILYLGFVATDAGGVTLVDYSGRVDLPGGLPVRRVGDLEGAVPEPPAGGTPVHLLKAGPVTYLWDGARWTLVVDPSARVALTSSSTLPDVVAALQGLGLAL